MHSEKKMTKEDTWRSEDLMWHIKKPRQRESERDRQQEDRRSQTREEREREKRRRERDRYGDGEHQGVESRTERGEKENREKEKAKQREGDKERKREKHGDAVRHRERDKERDGVRERDKDRETERERLKEREKARERNKERDREKDRRKENEREGGIGREGEKESDRERDRERERRKAERDKERKYEKERRKERETSGNVDEKNREREKEKERRERHKEKERLRDGEQGERRERDNGEKRSHREHSNREERKERRREKERHEEDERGRIHSGTRETERQHRHGDRERERARDREREKHKEKRPEKSEHGRKEEEVEQEVIEVNEAAEDYGNEAYADDFEDYEEDFEEVEEEEEEEEEEKVDEKRVREEHRALSPQRRKEMEAIQRAMEEENKLISTTHSQPSTSQSGPAHTERAGLESPWRRGRAQGRVIDFVAAQQRQADQQTASKQKKRSTELSKLIDLDFSVTVSLLDLHPVSEYDLYIKSFGTADTKQAYVQCNEENTDREVQTEETDTLEMWTQHPAEGSVVCGGPSLSHDASEESVGRMRVDSKRLNAFLLSAAQVIIVLLEEERAEKNSVKKLHSQTDPLSFSDGCVQLNTDLPFLQGRQVTMLHFSKAQTNTLLSVHSPCAALGVGTLDSKTVLCVWNIWETSTPQRVLVYEGEVQCCCFGAGKPALVFAGTAVGSVVLWDLREASSSHSRYRVGEEEWTLRYPTFSTDAVLSGAGHFSSVVSVEPLPVSGGAGLTDPLLPEQEEWLGMSFLLGSLDESGLLNLWVVVELAKADDSGSQIDLGLRPGGKVKLLHSSSLQTFGRLSPREVTEVTPHTAQLLKFLPSDSHHYVIGTNMGLVRRGTRHGLRAVPNIYRPKDRERPVDISALEFCPSGEPFFLVGCSDGTLRLHSVQCEEPVMEWQVGCGGEALLSVQWCPSRPTVFCALDAASVLHIWDLGERDNSPLITEHLHTDRVTAMAVWGGQGSQCGMALARRSGRLELHYLRQSLSAPRSSDSETLHALLQDSL